MDHPAIAAYNLINEPAPEKLGGLAEHASAERMQQWYAQARGGARDLPALYAQLVAAIREVDAKTPIMVDAGWYASADAFGYWQAPLQDDRVLYSVHMYEPYAATSARNLLRKAPSIIPARLRSLAKTSNGMVNGFASISNCRWPGWSVWGCRVPGWSWENSGACAGCPAAANTWKMSSRPWTGIGCTGRSTASAKIAGMAWTTSWDPQRCRGDIGKRSNRVHPTPCHARPRRNSSRSGDACQTEISCNNPDAGIYTYPC